MAFLFFFFISKDAKSNIATVVTHRGGPKEKKNVSERRESCAFQARHRQFTDNPPTRQHPRPWLLLRIVANKEFSSPWCAWLNGYANNMIRSWMIGRVLVLFAMGLGIGRTIRLMKI